MRSNSVDKATMFQMECVERRNQRKDFERSSAYMGGVAEETSFAQQRVFVRPVRRDRGLDLNLLTLPEEAKKMELRVRNIEVEERRAMEKDNNHKTSPRNYAGDYRNQREDFERSSAYMGGVAEEKSFTKQRVFVRPVRRDHGLDLNLLTSSEEAKKKKLRVRKIEGEERRAMEKDNSYKTSPRNYAGDFKNTSQRRTYMRHSTDKEFGKELDYIEIRGKKKRKSLEMPPLGQPGAFDDPLRKGLSGATCKWYLRFLNEGKSAEESRDLALKRPTIVGVGREHGFRNKKKKKIIPTRSDERDGLHSTSLNESSKNEVSKNEIISSVDQKNVNLTRAESRKEEKKLLLPKTESIALWHQHDKLKDSNQPSRNIGNTTNERKSEVIQFDLTRSETSRQGQLKTVTKRQRSELTTEMDVEHIECAPVENSRQFAEAIATTKMALVHKDHPDQKLPEQVAFNIKREIARRALVGKNIRTTSAHLEDGGVVVACANLETKCWLEGLLKDLECIAKTPLKIGLASCLVRITKLVVWIPKTTEATETGIILRGLKAQNDLKTENWAVVGSKTTSEGQYLVLHVDEESCRKLKGEFDMRPFLGVERVTFEHASSPKLE